ncbi:tRNA pseudouridine(38-40) synthase TruA [Aciduricibacillus chroicocephali]|uniref:tRNA pseudouridine synthase A n=1 Tax=Aciduricibacillus chroicocephali TaxID=3054939 RepID=A0ABY9KVR8_9BACI|nr:tRNA pseudouridine(38-40) synthase TruA [Bacillaceae bacterium 44XB]
MPRIKCLLSYDGTNYAGFQFQPNQRTVQGEIEKALTTFHKGTWTRIHASGRTDAGVHARGQVFHFDTAFNVPDENWKRALNTLLPDDLHIQHAEHVSEDFHARYSAVEKEYHYFIRTGIYDVFKRNYTHHIAYPLDLGAVREACGRLLGTHDFTTFSSAKSTAKGSCVRTLHEVSFLEQGDTLEFIFRGNGFLYNMVRIIIGVLLDIGKGKFEPGIIDEMLEKKDRQIHRKTAPPQGLHLWKVSYPDNLLK